MTDQESHLRWRDIETPCERCDGTGSRTYGSTATWHGGMGGASMTRDVCDACWGSGDADGPWTDLRKMRATMDDRVAAEAADLLAERSGCSFRVMRPGIRELVLELRKFDRGRKVRAQGFDTACRVLANVLTEICDAKERET